MNTKLEQRATGIDETEFNSGSNKQMTDYTKSLNQAKSYSIDKSPEIVENRYYEINFGHKQPKIDKRTIESYVLGEKRSHLIEGLTSSDIDSGEFNVNEIYTERARSVNPGILRRKDYVTHMIVRGTKSDFNSLEQIAVLFGSGKIVQVKKCPCDSRLSQYVEMQEKTSILNYRIPKNVKAGLAIFSVPINAVIGGSAVYTLTSFANLPKEAVGFSTIFATIVFGIASGIYTGFVLDDIYDSNKR